MKIGALFAALLLTAALTACDRSRNEAIDAATTPESAGPAAISGDAPAPHADPSAAISGAYIPDPNHRYITFSYFHQGYSHPVIRWGRWDAELKWDAADPEASSVTATIDINSVDSGVEVFDGHLRGAKLFDADHYPQATFVSTSLVKAGENRGIMIGDLTVKGVTRPVALDVLFNKGAYDDERNIYKIGFSAEGVIKRSEYGLDLYVPSVSDEVQVNIEVEFLMSAPEK